MFYRLFIILLFIPFSAQAIECESQSPLLVTMGDSYYDLDDNLDGDKVSKNHPLQKAIDTLQAMQFRKGHATSTICKRVDGVAIPETYTYTLRDGSSRYTKFGEIDINMWFNDAENRDIKRQNLILPLHVAWEAGNAKNQWLLNHRARRPGRGPFVEQDIILTVLDNGIDVMQITYTNGYLAEQSSWTLLKR